jgi:hypothetical protein
VPADEDPEDVRWQKLLAMRRGEGLGSVIWDASRPRSRDSGGTLALTRDGFSRRVWRE